MKYIQPSLQNRLPKKLALVGITGMQEANKFLKVKYLLQHNKRFAIKPEY